jgi:cell division protein FtsN
VSKRCLLITHLVLLLFSLPFTETAEAQDADQEVFLQFRHQGVVNTYVSALYHQDQFYLSVTDLFEALRIDLTVDTGRLTLTGNYLGRGTYTINLESRQARFLDREVTLTADDYAITEFGYYLLPEIFYQLFEQEFSVDFSNLAVTLETDDTMPVVAQRERERQRERVLRTQRELRREFYPLQFGRNPQVLNGGFLDYNLTANLNEAGNSYNFSSSIGSELAGGDLQGTVFGNYSATATSLRSSGLRWRYGVRDNPWVSTVVAGQTVAEGLSPVSYTGINITNDPIEPRFIYDETVLSGTVEPDSEVELYRNNTLVDFTQADGSGLYRFSIPLTYGTSNYSIRVYSPAGEMTQRDTRLQIPFNFLPPGEITYRVNAGRLDNPIAGSTERGMLAKGFVNTGITDRFTATGGVEYFEDFHEGLPTFVGRLSSRLGDSYLLSMEAANDAFYRVTGNVIYPNNMSLNVDYTHYNVQGGIYNPSRNHSSMRANIFTPIELGTLPLYLRWSVTNEQRQTGSVTRYRVDLNTRLGRANIRLGYRDSQLGTLQWQTTPVARANAAVTYNFPRSRSVPGFLQGVFARAQTNYIPAQSRIEDAELQVSRSISRRGRFQASAGRNFIGDFNLFRFTLTFDFSSFRTNTTARATRTASTVSQSVRGSVGYDTHHNNLLFTNRQQVGRSGVAVRMFVDNNNSGTFDEGDELIPENAIRIDRAGGSSYSRGGVNYISQLQPYRQYNMTVNKGQINNPLLVPALEQFSIVTDPNQFKLIEIPFYMSGIVDGMVYRERTDGTTEGLGGLRLYLTQTNVPEGVEPFSQEIRTFSDGSFYTYEIPPGDYTLQVDPSQLNFLNVKPEPEELEFTVRALAEGDFVEGLEINLVPADREDRPADDPVITATLSGLNGSAMPNIRNRECQYSLQVGSFSLFEYASEAASRAEQLLGREFEVSFNSANQLYAVRSDFSNDYLQLTQQLEQLRESGFDRMGIVHRCDEPVQPNQFHIQAGAFSGLENAERLANTLRETLPSHIFIHHDTQTGLYRVIAGPFSDQNALITALESLLHRAGLDDLLVHNGDREFSEEQEYQFELDLGTFADRDSAAAFAREKSAAADEELQIVQIDESAYKVVTRRTSDWDEIVRISNRLAAIAGLQAPVVQMIPSEDADTTGVPSEVEEPIVNVITEEDDLGIAGIPDHLQDGRMPPPHLLMGEADPLLQCHYPVQVGSFRGSALAEEKARELQQSLQTELNLIFNNRTGMFGLRTEPFDEIGDAMMQVTFFREADPANQYAIVGQCIERDAIQDGYARFAIPLIRYNHPSQANLYANLVHERYGIETTVRAAQGGTYFDVYAGPYLQYSRAVQMADRIKRDNISSRARIVVDPATIRSTHYLFHLYLGQEFTERNADAAGRQYYTDTGRPVTLEIDPQNRYNLFDYTEYRSWSRFLRFLEETLEQTSHQPVEIFIMED